MNLITAPQSLRSILVFDIDSQICNMSTEKIKTVLNNLKSHNSKAMMMTKKKMSMMVMMMKNNLTKSKKNLMKINHRKNQRKEEERKNDAFLLSFSQI